MQPLTLLIAAVGSVLILLGKPVTVLVTYIGILVWYPTYLTVQLGPLNFSARRILILVILVKIFLGQGLSAKFKFLLVDKFVLAYAGLALAAGVTTTEFGKVTAYWGGNVFMDEVLPYFAARILIAKREDYLNCLRMLLLISIPLAVVSILQCVTGYNPFGFFQQYNAFRAESRGYIPTPRRGFYRANLTFGVSIMLGLYFSIVCGCCVGLVRYIKREKRLLYTGLGVVGLGVLSSMSSGPWFMAAILAGILLLYKQRNYWKLFVTMLIGGIVFIEILSNSSWYEALSRFTFDSANAWYRTALIRRVFSGGMGGRWLTGYGLRDPGWAIGYVEHTDIVNHYIAVLVWWGLAGLVPFCGILACAFIRLREAFVAARTGADRWLIWTLMSTLTALLILFMSASLYAQTLTMFFILLAFCASAPAWIKGSGSAIGLTRSRDDRFVVVAGPANGEQRLRQAL